MKFDLIVLICLGTWVLILLTILIFKLINARNRQVFENAVIQENTDTVLIDGKEFEVWTIGDGKVPLVDFINVEGIELLPKRRRRQRIRTVRKAARKEYLVNAVVSGGVKTDDGRSVMFLRSISLIGDKTKAAEKELMKKGRKKRKALG